MGMVFTCLALLPPAFSLLPAPAGLTTCLQRGKNAPLPIGRSFERTPYPAASAAGLSPVTFSAQARSEGELLRTL